MTIEAPLVFLDTETTGLDLTDDIWEFSAIRRDPNGIETGCGMFIEHSAEKAARLPERFRADLERRYNPPFVLTQEVRSENTWTPALLIERQKRLVGVLEKHWSLAVLPTDSVSKAPDITTATQGQV